MNMQNKKEMSVLINGLIAFANGKKEGTIFSFLLLLSPFSPRHKKGKLSPPLSLSPLFGINRTHKSLSRPTEEPATPTLLLSFFSSFFLLNPQILSKCTVALREVKKENAF